MIRYDIDDKTVLPLEIINYLCVNDIEAWVRSSPSGQGLHVKINFDHDLPILTKWTDPEYQRKKEIFGWSLLWNEGAGPWFKIRNFGVYAE